jgi:hypothetical protein
MKTYSVELDDKLAEAIEGHAERDRRTPEAFIAMVIDKFVYGYVGRDYKPLTVEEMAAYRAEKLGGKTKRIPITAKQRNRIFERCEGRCAYCTGQLLYNDPWHIDHIVPLAKGGSNDEGNLTLACARCNVKKRDKATP